MGSTQQFHMADEPTTSNEHLHKSLREIFEQDEWPTGWRGQRVQRGLAWSPRMIIHGNGLCPTINPNQRNPYNKRIPQSTCINEDLPYKERPSPPRNKCQLYSTIKTPKPSQIKVRIYYPNSGTLELWEFSNLTFGGYLAGTTLVLSVRFSFSLLHRFCLEHVRTERLIDDFWHHQLALSVGNHSNNFIVVEVVLPLPGQRVVWYSLTRWLAPTIKETNHVLLPSKDKYKPSPQLWNASPSKTTT